MKRLAHGRKALLWLGAAAALWLHARAGHQLQRIIAFDKQFSAQLDKDGLIVDERDNSYRKIEAAVARGARAARYGGCSVAPGGDLRTESEDRQ